jgi:hypothetical protein
MQHKYKNGSAAYSQALSLDSHIFDAHSGAKLDAPAPPLEHGTAAYFKARSCALAGLNDCAITFLRKALDECVTVNQVSKEEEFTSLRNTPTFTHLAIEQ